MENRPAVSVRPARDEDDTDAMNIGNPAWMGAATMRQLLAASGEAPSGAFIAEVDGEPIGYGDCAAIAVLDGHRAPATVYIRPSARGQGAGTAIWSAVLKMCTPDRVSGVMLSADDEDAQSLAIALAHGFGLGGIQIESQLDLTNLDVDRMQELSAAPSGLTISPLPHDADEETWHDFADLHERLAGDTPDRASGSAPPPYAVIRAFLAEPWQVMGAWNGNEMVGFTAVSVRATGSGERVLNTHLTGVRPDYRSRGIATSLKATHAVALHRAGWQRIRTQNMEGNLPILASNKRLGFQRARIMRDLIYDHPAAA